MMSLYFANISRYKSFSRIGVNALKRELRLAQDRRFELGFDLFQLGKQEITTLDFFAVFRSG
jgi:hypothetical protein